jgi:hypothetical protein
MTQISESEKQLVSMIQQGVAKINLETGEVFEDFVCWPIRDTPIGQIRKKFIPNRRNLGLQHRFDWELIHEESGQGAYQQACLPMPRPYEA